MERTKVSPELYRAFEEYFPQVKSLAEEIQKDYNVLFKQIEPENSENKKPLKNVRKIGELQVYNESYSLPKLYFKKESDRTNPYFYLITSPDNIPIYAGTSLDTNGAASMSVSATTGGICPPTSTKDSYSIYLYLLSAVRYFGFCLVYDVQTGFENVKIEDYYGNDLTRTLKQDMASKIYSKLLWNNYKPGEVRFLSPLTKIGKQTSKEEEIWKCVSAFNTMVDNGLVKIEEKEDKQTITLIPIAGGLKISFSKKVKFENDYSPLSDNFVASHVEQASKLMKNEKFWDQVEKSASTLDHNKVNEYFKNQYKEYPVPGEDTRVPIIREAKSTKQNEFEKKIKKASFGNVSFRYVNILGSENSSILFDGGDSSIEIYGECANPTLFEIQEIIEAVTTAFGIDDGETRISTEAVESALGDK